MELVSAPHCRTRTESVSHLLSSLTFLPSSSPLQSEPETEASEEKNHEAMPPPPPPTVCVCVCPFPNVCTYTELVSEPRGHAPPTPTHGMCVCPFPNVCTYTELVSAPHCRTRTESVSHLLSSLTSLPSSSPLQSEPETEASKEKNHEAMPPPPPPTMNSFFFSHY